MCNNKENARAQEGTCTHMPAHPSAAKPSPLVTAAAAAAPYRREGRSGVAGLTADS